MSALEDTGMIVGEPLLKITNSVIDALPGVLAAVLLLILGYLIGSLVGHIVRKVLDRTRLVPITVKKLGLEKEIGKWDISGFFGLIIKWSVFVAFLPPAADVVSLTSFGMMLTSIALWIPNIIVAIITVLAGLVFAEYIAKKIKETRAKERSLLASGAKAITLAYVILIALRQVGVQISFAENSFLIILAGVVFGCALAFGLGFKDEARDIDREIRKRL